MIKSIVLVCFALIAFVVFSVSNHPLLAQVQSLGALPLKWHPDGQTIAIPVGRMVEVWSIVDKQHLHTLRGHIRDVSMIAWSPDGLSLATASYDQTVKVWDISTGDLSLTLIHTDDAVVSVIWSLDGSKIISTKAEEKPAMTVWNAQTGEVLSSHVAGTIEDLKFSPDGRFLAYSTSLALIVLDSSNYTQLAQFSALCCSNQMQVLAWSPDSTKIVTGSLNGLITLWDATTLQTLNQFPANVYAKPDASQVEDLARSWVRDVAFSPDGSSVLAISGDGTFREWAVQDGALLRERQLPPLATATFSPYTGRLVYLDLHLLTAVQGATTAQDLTDGLHIIVPDPSFENLNRLAARCVQDGNATQSAGAQLAEVAVTEASLATFITQVKNLPPDAILPACAADLLAIAAALQ